MTVSDLYRINPYIRVAMHSVLKRGTHINERAIFDYELLYVADGAFVLTYNGQAYHCTQGQFLLLCPGVPHSFDCTESNLSQPHIHFDMIYTAESPSIPVSFKHPSRFTPQERERMQPNFFEGASPLISFAEKPTALSLFYSVIEAHGQGDLLPAKSKMTALVDLLIRDHFAATPTSEMSSLYAVADQIKGFFDAGQGLSMSLDDLEQQFSYNKFHLERLFRQRYQTGLIAYRNRRRMAVAAELLTAHSVSEVATLTGFSSIYAFSRAFKRHFGVPPTKYVP